MDYFPIFLRLDAQPVLVVGGGHVAERKIELLRRAGAKITVVAPALCESLATLAAQGSIQHVCEEFKPEHLNGMRLAIAATNLRSVNAWVAHQAEGRAIPVNVVDDRELSRFIVPAIVDRSPVVVAVASSGDAPVLTRRLREKFESLLPEGLGRLAALSGQLRNKVKQRFRNSAQRRRFWESFFDGPIAADVLAGRDTEAHARIDHALAQGEEVSPRGEVALVGAGPGDPGLLTLRALRALQNADVVLYDRLVSSQVLDLARRDAEKIYVGKAAGHAHVPQEGINRLLVDLAQQGKRVCRLKGGDPFIFGRGGEELEALARAGIRFEVVPGITAAAGCAAYAGIPLTHRDYAQSVTFATGHCKGDDDNIDWEMLARPNQTVVFYMGLRALDNIIERLQTHGVPGTRAVAVIEQGTQSSQRVITATLTTLRARVLEAKVQSPALLIVGEVTRLHAVLDWFNTSSHSYAQADTSTDDSRFLSGRFTSGRLTA